MVRKAILVIAAAVLLIAVAACAPAPPEEIKIGAIMSKTGALAAVGELIGDGAELAVKEINAAGGVLGKPVKLLLEDDATDPAKSLEAFKKLVEVEGVEVVVGPMISGAVMSIGPYAKERGVLLVSPSATSPAISEEPWTDFAFRTTPSDTLQGKALAQVITERGFKKVAILVMDNAYGVGIEVVAEEELKDKVDIVASIRYDPAKLDYLTELGIIKDKKPDAVLHVGYHDDAAVVYRQALELGLDAIQWIAAEGVYGFDFKISEDASEFMRKAVIGTGLTAVGPAQDEFRAAYKKEFGVDPGVYCDTAYDAVKLLALAIEKAGVYDGAKIRDALWEVGKEYAGVSGTITFDEKGDRVSGTYEVWKVDLVEGEYSWERIGLISL
ncbi:branched-chain amino acid transport system substrate-binding protein [Candidatus Hakubella thermalkaliphila]|uniref:Branched-chain amino acid transport system substrate-binding protein n=2 Tax=Candidatus Hakubella thermalkaliphila TaxID=2754717 RepID=A0A6V8NP00_9ACTN|nr:ABC transporter substrate-binding protein [Candidatus Hakubella thermalkaliphila]GFP21084.1 branched-chain amino acid transport system substrate-binding protein [Candidatus Hakubella thermalkaliphila]